MYLAAPSVLFIVLAAASPGPDRIVAGGGTAQRAEPFPGKWVRKELTCYLRMFGSVTKPRSFFCAHTNGPLSHCPARPGHVGYDREGANPKSKSKGEVP